MAFLNLTVWVNVRRFLIDVCHFHQEGVVCSG